MLNKDLQAKEQEKKERYLRAKSVLTRFLGKSSEVLYRVADQEDCLEEIKELTGWVIDWLDDEPFYEEAAFEYVMNQLQEENPEDLTPWI